MSPGFVPILFAVTNGSRAMWVALWIGLALLSISLLALVRTRWGQSHPLRKCVILSLLAHALLAGYATTVHIVAFPTTSTATVTVHVSLLDVQPGEPGTGPARVAAEEEPAASILEELETANDPFATPSEAVIEKPEIELNPSNSDRLATQAVTHASHEAPSRNPLETDPDSQPQAETSAASETEADADSQSENVSALHQTEEVVSPPDEIAKDVAPFEEDDAPTVAIEPRPRKVSSRKSTRAASTDDQPLDPTQRDLLPEMDTEQVDQDDSQVDQDESQELPARYRLRQAADRLTVVERQGGSPETEQAVQAALTWLSLHQSTDGRWDASQFGAGRGNSPDGHDRRGAGTLADTGITGLALLAFLGAGHTHLQGEFRDNVRDGLEYLLRSQASDGNLGGAAETCAFMYCHGIAAFALSEAYGMTNERRLLEPLRRAIRYTMDSQASSGGWRYHARDSGDTSQLGWQLMALKSAELAGIEVPQEVHDGMARFLRGVSSGRRGGLGSYRPGERVTRPMTAEALVCRQFLGLPGQTAAAEEAGDYLMGELPGEGQDNLYYWYYGTLGMYQLQGELWTAWNEALTETLLASQVTSGDLAGSWQPDRVWGVHGGRVYSTALSCLCLEVYYRYLPLWQQQARRNSDAK